MKGMTPHKNRKITRRKSRTKLWLAISIIAIVIIAVAAYQVLGQQANPSPSPTPSPSATPTSSPSTNSTKVLLETTLGNITLELHDDKPITSGNFKNLVQQGKYDGTLFHRIIDGFVIQGGEINEDIPTIPDEIGTNNRNLAYTIAMAKTSEPDSATSQFFINLVDNGNKVIDQAGTKFDAGYTVFGTVISGQDVVDSIAKQPVAKNQFGENSQPVAMIILLKASVVP